MRIDTQLSEETSEDIQDLADEKGWQKPKAYTELINTGLRTQNRRETIKQYIVDFFEEEKPRHEERFEALKDEYGIEEVEWEDHQMNVIYKGDEYSFPGDPSDLALINGDSYQKTVCPECGSEELDLDFETDDGIPVHYNCRECSTEFEKPEREFRVPKEDIDHVKEFAWKRHQLFGYVEGKLKEILDSTMTSHGRGRGEWLHTNTYRYDNGFQSVTVPFWCTDKERIRFNIDSGVSSLESILNPMSRKAKMNLADDYLQLVSEVEAVNADADKVEPIYIDMRGSKPEIIEVQGLSYEDTHLPYRTVGYELEKVQPEEDDLTTEFEGLEGDNAVQITAKPNVDEITWIRVVNDKRIELPQEYEIETDDYYLAISTESLNPIHLINRETQEPYCGEELEEVTTDNDRLNGDEPVVRNGICNGCLDEYENFSDQESGGENHG